MIKPLKMIMALGAIALVSACADTQTASRNAGFEGSNIPTVVSLPGVQGSMSLREIERNEFAQTVPEASPLRVDRVTIVVPDTLSVSERNSFLPKADIVWRDDPIGDRHAQVQDIFETAFEAGTQRMEGDFGVTIYVQVMRFHAITEKARASVGGVHDITFGLAIRDSGTGQFVMEPKVINADLEAFGGRTAMMADARGETQKVRITQHLAEVIRQELTKPGGFTNPRLGFVQNLNEQS